MTAEPHDGFYTTSRDVTGNDVILTLSTGHQTIVNGRGGLYAVLPTR